MESLPLELQHHSLSYIINSYLHYLSEENILLRDIVNYEGFDLEKFSNSQTKNSVKLIEKLLMENDVSRVWIYITKKNSTFVRRTAVNISPADVMKMIRGSEYIVVFCRDSE